jgi:phospholipid/cholesterol/gamma-HCH transport system ATP-binding protein
MNKVEKRDDTKEAVISIRHLKKSFGSNVVLKNISLDLHKQENLAILGRSGVGKSVTIKCIVALMEFDEGTINVLGREIKKTDEDMLREIRIKVGFLFQGGALYDSMTVRDNLAFPLTRVLKLHNKGEIDKRVTEMLDHVDLKDAIDKLPADLSGGMRKRIALARTLILGPEIILYDEPTTGLDPMTSREISDLIVSMQKKYKTSSLIITHDMSCARATADRMLVMDNGEFIAEGTYQDLEKSDNSLVQSFFK